MSIGIGVIGAGAIGADYVRIIAEVAEAGVQTFETRTPVRVELPLISKQYSAEYRCGQGD